MSATGDQHRRNLQNKIEEEWKPRNRRLRRRYDSWMVRAQWIVGSLAILSVGSCVVKHVFR